MNNFKAKKFCRFMAKIFFYLCTVIIIFVLFVTFRLCIICNSNYNNPKFTNGELEMYMLDIGQGDSYLFLQNNKCLLVDTGTIYDWNATKSNLEELGVKKIDYMIISHPHQDHAGGMFSILLNYQVKHLYVTDMSTAKMSFSDGLFYCMYSGFINLVNQIYDCKLITPAKENGVFNDFTFSKTEVKFLTPISDSYNIFNNYSLVCKLTYKQTDILLTGDIQSEVENELLDSGEDLSADIYKAAHHGSKTSNTDDFLSAVNPEYVLISSDNGNKNLYGHPVERFMNYLETNNIKVFRTDELGTVKMTTDGKNIVFDSLEGDYKSGTELLQSMKKG